MNETLKNMLMEATPPSGKNYDAIAVVGDWCTEQGMPEGEGFHYIHEHKLWPKMIQTPEFLRPTQEAPLGVDAEWIDSRRRYVHHGPVVWFWESGGVYKPEKHKLAYKMYMMLKGVLGNSINRVYYPDIPTALHVCAVAAVEYREHCDKMLKYRFK